MDCAKETVTGFISDRIYKVNNIRTAPAESRRRLDDSHCQEVARPLQEEINPPQRTIYLSDPPGTILDHGMAKEDQQK
jgi:hypothetical protein